MKQIARLTHVAATAVLALIAILLVIFSFYYFSDSESLFANYVAEIVGAIVTVGVIDRLLSRRESKRNIPAKYAALRDCTLILSKVDSLWYEIIDATTNNQEHKKLLENYHITDLNITDINQRLAKIAYHIDLNSGARVVPARSWSEFLTDMTREIDGIIEKCLSRYSTFLDPE